MGDKNKVLQVPPEEKFSWLVISNKSAAWWAEPTSLKRTERHLLNDPPAKRVLTQ